MQRRRFLKSLVVGTPALAMGLRAAAQTWNSGTDASQGTDAINHSGLFGSISDVTVQTVNRPTPLAPAYISPDADLSLMAAWALRHLVRNPRPALNYEPVFMVRPLHVPP